jgi:hypothetical protein
MSPGVFPAMAHASGGGVFEGRDGLGGILWNEVVGLKTPWGELLTVRKERNRAGIDGGGD